MHFNKRELFSEQHLLQLKMKRVWLNTLYIFTSILSCFLPEVKKRKLIKLKFVLKSQK